MITYTVDICYDSKSKESAQKTVKRYIKKGFKLIKEDKTIKYFQLKK